MSVRSSWLLTVLLVSHAGVSQATLGDVPGASTNSLPSLTTTGVSYSRQEMVQANGTRVREYVSAAGTVFAVSWDGPFLPDLRQLLGPHFDTLTAEASRLPKAGRSQLSLNRPDIVIFSGGHMRAYSGHAWLPAQLPAGFNTDAMH